MRQLSEATMKHWREAREACLENAKELLNSAGALNGKNTAHIRYHLTVLAMEEVGKAELLSVGFSSLRFDENDVETHISLDDHVKKLFWAIFTPFIEQKRVTKEDFESYRGFAKNIHERRLESLYTNPHRPLLPENRVSDDEADSLAKFAESRLNLEKGYDINDSPDEARLEDLNWFHYVSNNPEHRRLIFSSASLDKLGELRSVPDWIRWLREEFSESERESREILQQELEKGVVEGVEGDEPKWKVKFRIYSASHSIRPKATNEWNENCGSIIKIYNSNKKRKNELICELTLGKRVPVQALWNSAKAISSEFVAALNIGTMGLFWWHVEKDVSRFYEKIVDLENDVEARISISPELSIDWGHLVLTEDDLRFTNRMFVYILKSCHSNPRYGEALDLYLNGLALLSTNDLHLRVEASAFEHFFMVLKTLLRVSGDWDGHTDFKFAVHTQLSEFLTTSTKLLDYLKIGMQLEQRKLPIKRITLTEAIGMKQYCDIYYTLLARREDDVRRAQA